MTDRRSNPKAISIRAFADMSDRWRSPHRLVGLVGGRWTLAVLAELADHGRRYQDLHDSLEGISHKVLTDTLRRAERDGLITRHLDPGRVDTATLATSSPISDGLSTSRSLPWGSGWPRSRTSLMRPAAARMSRRTDAYLIASAVSATLLRLLIPRG